MEARGIIKATLINLEREVFRITFKIQEGDFVEIEEEAEVVDGITAADHNVNCMETCTHNPEMLLSISYKVYWS